MASSWLQIRTTQKSWLDTQLRIGISFGACTEGEKNQKMLCPLENLGEELDCLVVAIDGTRETLGAARTAILIVGAS